jgi:hypothetical protein
MINQKSTPVNLPEELRVLLEQSKTEEQECAECYNGNSDWIQMTPDMPDLILSDVEDKSTNIKPKEYAKMDNNEHFWKYNEGKTLRQAEEYIKGTYKQHYTSEESKVQVLDIIESIGDGVPFCRDNLIKYSARFGKKNGLSKLDALKIIHYGILLYNFAGFHKNNTDRYETF